MSRNRSLPSCSIVQFYVTKYTYGLMEVPTEWPGSSSQLLRYSSVQFRSGQVRSRSDRQYFCRTNTGVAIMCYVWHCGTFLSVADSDREGCKLTGLDHWSIGLPHAKYSSCWERSTAQLGTVGYRGASLLLHDCTCLTRKSPTLLTSLGFRWRSLRQCKLVITPHTKTYRRIN